MTTTIYQDEATDQVNPWLEKVPLNLRTPVMSNNNVVEKDKQEISNEKVSLKNAFKIRPKKGVRFTQSIKKELNDDIGCHYDSLHKAYVCPIDSKDKVFNLFNESQLKVELIDIFDFSQTKSKKINGIENNLEYLQKKAHDDYMQLLVEISKYDPQKHISELKDPPNKENFTEDESEERKNIRFSIEMDLHKRYLKNKEDEQEVENLRSSLKLHEKEEIFECKILENLQKNEIGDAEVFVGIFKDKYVFDPSEGTSGSFYLWNGTSWAIDIRKERYKDFDAVADAYLNASNHNKIEDTVRKDLLERAQKLRTNNRRRNVLETVTAHISLNAVWDYVPKLLPCANGVIDLITGEFSPSKQEQFIRKVCPIKYNQSAKCPKFMQFLEDISLGKIDWIAFLQRLIGYAVLGVPSEEIIIYLYGLNGRNGKGTLMKVLQHILGPLARTFPAEMVLLQRNPPSSSSPSPELANLQGVRLAVFSEIPEKARIDSAKVKNLSGRDKISCRRLFSNIDLQIEPTHTMFLQTNYKPKASADDNALWSRNILVPFNASFKREPEKKNERPLKENLKEELLEEAEGILLWVLEGVREYQSIGLRIPEFIKRETEDYRKENDGVGRFLEEMCIEDPVWSTTKSKMEAAIKEFCIASGCEVPNRNEISAYLKTRFQEFKDEKSRYWKGVKIANENELK